MLGRSQALLDAFRKAEENRKPLFILTGSINQGKTSLARQVIEKLQKEGLTVRGFITRGNTNNKQRNTYFIKNLQTGEEEQLCSSEPDKSKLHFGRYYFDKKGIEEGCSIITDSLTKSTDLLVVDELGPMEMNDNGWAPAIEKVVERNCCAQFWVIRKRLVKPFMRKWNVGDITLFDLEEDSPDKIANAIKLSLQKAAG